MKASEKEILADMQLLVATLQSGKDIASVFNCHTVYLDLLPSQYSPAKVSETRKLLQMSQPIFAQFLGVATATVRAWEQGANVPSAMACRFMDEIRNDIPRFQQRLQQQMRTKVTKPAKPRLTKGGETTNR